MSNTLFKAIKKSIEHKLYTISDIMEFQIELSGSIDINKSGKHFMISNMLSRLKKILSTGELPQINPDFDEYSVEGSINDEKLFEYLHRNCYYEIQQLDVKSNYVTLKLNLKMIFLNFIDLSEEDLKCITYVKIKSFMGESEIGEKKESLHVS
jgi:hypothetical protein